MIARIRMTGLPSLPGVTHRDVVARGLRVHVAESGQGPTLVLQHGWPQHWYAWHALIPELARRFRVICPDMRGFGWSDAPADGYDKEGLAEDLLAVCDALGVERFFLAGHDWGGYVAFVVAMRSPDRVERLVMLNTGHGFVRVDLRLLRMQLGFWYMPIIGMPWLGPALVRRGGIVRAIVHWSHPGGVPWDEATWETYLAPLRERARARATQRLYGLFVAREFPRVLAGRWKRERLRVPTLFLHGAADRALRPDFLRGYEPYADDLRLELLDGVGHFICDAQPELVIRRMIAFLQPDSTSRQA
jgi:pimeloyl-ACP methyl ester carboxylesterase